MSESPDFAEVMIGYPTKESAPLDAVDRVRMTLAMQDAGYSAHFQQEDIEGLLRAYDALRAEPTQRKGCNVIPEPMLTVDLEDSNEGDTTEWAVKMLRTLAAQLTVRNDYYFPLLAVATHLETEPASPPSAKGTE